MWVILRDTHTAFHVLDKFIVGLVEDKDIFTYQQQLASRIGGRKQEIHTNNPFLQLFLIGDDGEYYVRRYEPLDITTLETNKTSQPVPKTPDRHSVWTTPVSVRRTPYNTEQ